MHSKVFLSHFSLTTWDQVIHVKSELPPNVNFCRRSRYFKGRQSNFFKTEMAPSCRARKESWEGQSGVNLDPTGASILDSQGSGWRECDRVQDLKSTSESDPWSGPRLEPPGSAQTLAAGDPGGDHDGNDGEQDDPHHDRVDLG